MEYLFVRFYWFYKSVIKEKDEVMIYYFASFAISLLTYFYIHLLWSILYFFTKIDFLEYNGTSFTVLGFLFVGLMVYSIFKNKVLYEKKASVFHKRFSMIDLWAVLFTLGGFA